MFLIDLAYRLGQLSVTDPTKVPDELFTALFDQALFELTWDHTLPSRILRVIIRKEYKRIAQEVVPFKLEQTVIYKGPDSLYVQSLGTRCYCVTHLSDSSYLVLAKVSPASRLEPVLVSWSLSDESTHVETDALFARKVTFLVDTIGRSGLMQLIEAQPELTGRFLQRILDDMAASVQRSFYRREHNLLLGQQLAGLAQCLGHHQFAKADYEKRNLKNR